MRLGNVVGKGAEYQSACGSVFDWPGLRALGLDCVSVGSGFLCFHLALGGNGSRISGHPPSLKRSFAAARRLRDAVNTAVELARKRAFSNDCEPTEPEASRPSLVISSEAVSRRFQKSID